MKCYFWAASDGVYDQTGRAGSRSTYYSCQKKSVMIMVDRHRKHARVCVCSREGKIRIKKSLKISFEKIVNEHRLKIA